MRLSETIAALKEISGRSIEELENDNVETKFREAMADSIAEGQSPEWIAIGQAAAILVSVTVDPEDFNELEDEYIEIAKYAGVLVRKTIISYWRKFPMSGILNVNGKVDVRSPVFTAVMQRIKFGA